MPTYELALLFKQMTRPDLVAALKRTAETIWNEGGIIRNLENLGSRQLSYKISEHGLVHREGSYFIMNFDIAPTKVNRLRNDIGRDIDIIRRHIFKQNEQPANYKCTLHEESLPPAYRKDVQEMVEIAKRKQKRKFKYNTGLNYYPFQK